MANSKDYGIMALLAHSKIHPSGLIPFPFVFPPYAPYLSAFFFPVFLLEKVMRSASGAGLSPIENWRKMQKDCII